MGFYSSHIEMLKPQVMMSHYDYISRKGKYAKRKDFVFSESDHLPKWANDEVDYWETIMKKEIENEEKVQSGKYGEKQCAVRKIIFALPNEMSEEEMIQFTRDYLDANYKDLPRTFVIHKKDSAIYGIQNPHVHVIFSDYVDNKRSQNLDRDTYFKKHGVSKAGREYGGAYRTRDYTTRPPKAYRQARKDLADRINAFYKERGIDKHVSEKSIKEQIKEAIAQGDYITAESLKREKPFRLNPQKFKQYGKLIQEKVLAGWRNVENLDDVPDPEVRERIAQEFEKQMKEELLQFAKSQMRTPSDRDKIQAIENKMDEIKTLLSYAPNRESGLTERYEKRLEKLEKEKDWISLRLSENAPSNYYLTQKEQNRLTDAYKEEEIKSIMEKSDGEKIKEYAIAAYTIREMRKRMNTLSKEREDIALLKKINQKTNGEGEVLKKKLDSRESLLRYLEKTGKDTDKVQEEIEDIQKQITELTEKTLTKEEIQEITQKIERNKNEIYKLREISSSYASRIRDAGIDEAFRKDHKEEIKEYVESLERLSRYKIDEKLKTQEKERKPFFLDEPRHQLINDTVLKKIETFQKELQTETFRNWEAAEKKALNDITGGLLEKLEKEKKALHQLQSKTPAYEVEKQQKLISQIQENQKEINTLYRFYKTEIKEGATKILKDWRKDRNEKVAALEKLQKELAKDSHRKYLHSDIRQKAKEILKGSNRKIEYIKVRTGHSPMEKERLARLREGYEKENLTFMKTYNTLIPHTEKYYMEQLIDEQNHGQLTKMKNQIRDLEKQKEKLEQPDPAIDQHIEKLHKLINRTIEVYRTPELMEKAKELSTESVKQWPENRAKALELVKRFKRHSQKARITKTEKRRKEKILSYAKYQVSKKKLLNDTVTTKILSFKDRVMATLPHKTEYYIKQVINEQTNHELAKKEALLKQSERIVKDLLKNYPDDSPAVMQAKETSEKLKQDMAQFIKDHTTPEVMETAKKRRTAAIKNQEVNINALLEEHKALQKDAQRKHLSPGIAKRADRNMTFLGKVLNRQKKRNQKFKEFFKSQYFSNEQSTAGMGAEQAMDKLENLAGPGIKRANIKVYRNDQNMEW